MLTIMRLRVHRKRQEPWSERRQRLKRSWTAPVGFEWFTEWVEYVMSNLFLPQVLDI